MYFFIKKKSSAISYFSMPIGTHLILIEVPLMTMILWKIKNCVGKVILISTYIITSHVSVKKYMTTSLI